MADLRLFGATSNLIRFVLTNSSTGQPLTGLSGSSSGLIISTVCDVEAAATAYTATGSSIQTIATLGTFAAPTSGDCRFAQVDATNHPGLYEFQFADARFAISNAKRLVITVSGATNLLTTHYEIELVQFNPFSSSNLGLSAIPTANPGASGGLFIAGTNAATTITSSLTTTFTGNLTGSVASVSGAVGSVTGSVGSVTGNVGGSVTGSVGSVTGNVGGSVTGSVGSISGVTFPTHFNLLAIDGSGDVTFNNTSIASVTGSVSSVVGSVGSISGVTFPSGFSSLTTAAIATKVWTDTTSSDFTTAASPGAILVEQLGGTFTSNSSSVFSSASLANAPTGGGSAPTAAQIATAVWTDTTSSDFTATGSPGSILAGPSGIENNYSFQQIMRLISAVLLGQSSGVSSGSPVYRDVNNTTNRVSATASNGDRSSVTLNAS